MIVSIVLKLHADSAKMYANYVPIALIFLFTSNFQKLKVFRKDTSLRTLVYFLKQL